MPWLLYRGISTNKFIKRVKGWLQAAVTPVRLGLRRNTFIGSSTIKQKAARCYTVEVSDTTMLNMVIQLVKKKMR
jgi:hypothetical protein